MNKKYIQEKDKTVANKAVLTSFRLKKMYIDMLEQIAKKENKTKTKVIAELIQNRYNYYFDGNTKVLVRFIKELIDKAISVDDNTINDNIEKASEG